MARPIQGIVVFFLAVGIPALLAWGLDRIAARPFQGRVLAAFFLGGGPCYLLALALALFHQDDFFGRAALPLFMLLAALAAFWIPFFYWGLLHTFARKETLGSNSSMRAYGVIVVILCLGAFIVGLGL